MQLNVFSFSPFRKCLQITSPGWRSSAALMSPHQRFTGIKELGEEEPEGVPSSATR